MDLARAAAENHAQNPSLALTFGKALGGAGMLAEAVAALGDACGRFPSDEALHEELAEALARADDIEAALALARAWPRSRWSPRFAFKLLRRQGRLTEAAKFEAAIAAWFPTDPDLLEARAEGSRSSPAALLSAAESVLALDPAAMHAVFYKAIALAQLGQVEAAAQLMDISRFLSIATLPPGDSLISEPDFSQALGKEIRDNPTLHADPAGHASCGGLRTRSYPLESDRAGSALIDSIKSAVSTYADALSGDHPFVKARPERATFTPWALVFPAGGHQQLHQHPARWLTGVYYVSVAQSESDPDATAAGAIRVGGLPDWAQVEPPWPVLTITPKPRMLLLFPSFVPHETVPNSIAGDRISVAFDVAAEQQEAAARSGERSPHLFLGAY